MSESLRAQLEQMTAAEQKAVLLWLADFAAPETAAAVREVKNAQADAAVRYFTAPSPNRGNPVVWSSQEVPLPPATAAAEIPAYVDPPASEQYGPLHPYM